MRDYILGSDEYLIKSQEMIEEHMGRCRREAEEEQQNLMRETTPPPHHPHQMQAAYLMTQKKD